MARKTNVDEIGADQNVGLEPEVDANLDETVKVKPVRKPTATQRRGRTPRDPEATVRWTPAQSLERQIGSLGFSMELAEGAAGNHRRMLAEAARNHRSELARGFLGEIGDLRKQAAGLHEIIVLVHGEQMKALGLIHEQNSASPIVRIFAAIGIAAVVLIAMLALSNWTAVYHALFG